VTVVGVREVRDAGLAGTFYAPGSRPRPGVLALGGSEGGRPEHLAGLLANEGFACLALSYFGSAPLPRHLVEIPLDYIETALEWLGEQPEVAGRRPGVIGASKGAELALLTAALLPEEVGAVVAYAPSAVAFPGIAFVGGGRRRSSWSFRGAPLPFVPYPRSARPSLGWRGLSLAPMYRAALDDAATVAAAAIPVERCEAPIMLISGDKDRMWPSSAMAQMLAARLAQAGKADRVVHLRYANAGHSFMPWAPGRAPGRVGRVADAVRLAGFGGMFDLGGKSSANRQALQQAWPRAVSFLREHLD
jgi:dienelactone hydrolase